MCQIKKYLNYEKTQCIDKIPEGYYLKDKILKIIDICHSDCKECLKKEDEKSSNCISCLNDKFLDNGNCVLSCDNYYFEDLLGNKKCKCINNKCKECSYDSIMLDLCISCNENYYPKIDDEINENNFTNCYQDPDGYYLDKYIYKPCYESCLKCSELGDSSDNKCLECKTGYSKIDNSQNCYENCKYYYYFNSSNIYHCTEKNKCPKEQSKLIKEKNKCIKNCSDDDIYKCEINNICYECYEEKTDSINENEKECPYDTPYQLKNEDCVSECNAIDFFNGVCKISNDNSSILENMIEIIKSQLENKELEGLLSNVEDGEKKDLLIKVYNMTYQLTTTENQKNKNYTNISTINLNNCEDILKSENGIDPNKSLIIFKVDYYMEGISIPAIGYEVYNPDTKQKLSLKSCEDILINLDIPVSIDETILFKYDPNDEYYNDECFSYTTDKGTDIILNDRKKEFINNNMSLCENKCSYIGYTEKSKKASCKCDIKSTELKLSQIFDEENILSNNFTFDEYSKSNLITMKCASKLFTKNGLLTNIANYILIIFTITFAILFILYFKVGIHFIEKDIEKILSDKKILKKSLLNIGKIKTKKKKYSTISKKSNISNPLRNKINKNVNKTTIKKIKNSSNSKFKSFSKIELKNTNILINMGNNQNNQIDIYNKNSNKAVTINKILNIENYHFYDSELNSLSYQYALLFDKRTYFSYYISLLKTKHPLIFIFLHNVDYNLAIVKIAIFILSFSIYYSINTLFFNNKEIHKIYENNGNMNISSQIPKIIYSFLVSHFICCLIKFFSLSESNLLAIK